MNKKEFSEHVGMTIKSLRLMQGVSQTELSRLIGRKDRSTIQDIETGKSYLTLLDLKKILDALNLSHLRQEIVSSIYDPLTIDGVTEILACAYYYKDFVLVLTTKLVWVVAHKQKRFEFHGSRQEAVEFVKSL